MRCKFTNITDHFKSISIPRVNGLFFKQAPIYTTEYLITLPKR